MAAAMSFHTKHGIFLHGIMTGKCFKEEIPEWITIN
jgi:hypothetical protein